jgi:hypothetical protein
MHYAPKHNEAALLTAAFAGEGLSDPPTRTLDGPVSRTG